MNISQHLESLEIECQSRRGERTKLSELPILQSRTLDDEELERFEQLNAEITQLETDIRTYRAMEASEMATAQAVPQGPTILTHKREREEDFEGQNFVRKLIARAHGKFFDEDPVAVAKARWNDNDRLVQVIASGVPGHGSGSGEPGGELVSTDNRYTGDFIEYLYSQTVYNQLPLREAPANVTIKGQDGAATGYWVGEGKPIPASNSSYTDINLTPLKAAAVGVASKELLRDSSPAAERIIRDSLVDAIAQRIDTTFIGAAAAVANVSPAGILYNPSLQPPALATILTP